MSITSYLKFSGDGRVKIERKKSRFVGIGFPCPSESAFQQNLTRIEGEFSDASHVCYAFRILNERKRIVEKYENDGEPAGTAGEPLLNLLKGREICDSCLVVIRYFGGVKLGTGGLVRAYSGAGRLVIDEIELVNHHVTEIVRIAYPYRLTGKVMNLVQLEGIQLRGVDYGEEVTASLIVPLDRMDRLKSRFEGVGGGQIEWSAT